MLRRMLELAAQGHQPMPVARLGLLRVHRLEQDDVAIQEPGHAVDQAVAQPQQDEADTRQPNDRQCHPDEPQGHSPQPKERPQRARG